MNTSILILQLINLAFIGLLPRLFFRADGRFNLMWWLTAIPFVLSAVLLIGVYTGQLFVFNISKLAYTDVLSVIIVMLNSVSIALIAYTLGTHTKRISLWHQTNDAPEHIVTTGAYKYIRHPFYTSFILTVSAVAIHIPHISTILLLVYTILILNFTASREERNLSQSEFGKEYLEYLKHSGRFFPKFGTQA